MKQKIRTLRVAIYILFEGVIAFLVFYSVLFFFGGTIPVGELPAAGDITFFVQSNGVHTDVCLPVQSELIDWSSVVPLKDFPTVKNPRYISMGWGDKGFFLDTPEWSDLTLNTALNAAFFKSGTAMHVSYMVKEPLVSNRVAKVQVTTKNYERLIAYILDSFNRNHNGVQLIANKGYWEYDNFYEAKGNYHLFNTCNAWTNGALKVSGIKTGLFSLSADGIMRHLKSVN